MKKLSLSMTAVIFTWSFILMACSAQIAAINAGADGVALKGYDPVAYFTQGRPVKGLKEFQFEWNNAKWLFASSEHLTLFQENPEKYAPQYGGY
jgi:YHS domain-containing protein